MPIMIYSNYFSEVPGQVRTGVRFVPATLDPEGNPLQTPGVVYEQEAVKIDYLDTQLDRKYIWDMEKVLNVWVCPIDNAQTDLAGFRAFLSLIAMSAWRAATSINPVSSRESSSTQTTILHGISNIHLLTKLGISWGSTMFSQRTIAMTRPGMITMHSGLKQMECTFSSAGMIKKVGGQTTSWIMIRPS